MREALIQGILEHPHEVDRKLIYADWLEENGDADDLQRANFIRSMIRSGKNKDFSVSSEGGMNRKVAKRCGWPGPHGGDPNYHGQKGRVRIFQGFITQVSVPWATWKLIGVSLIKSHPVESVALLHSGLFDFPLLPTSYVGGGFCFLRIPAGNPQSVRLGYAHWLEHDLFDLLEDFDDKQRSAIPDWQVKGFLSIKDALKSVSKACLRWAREASIAHQGTP